MQKSNDTPSENKVKVHVMLCDVFEGETGVKKTCGTVSFRASKSDLVLPLAATGTGLDQNGRSLETLTHRT